MTITHHPSAATLAAYAAGSLDTARRLVVASHLERCAQCRRSVEGFEVAGGVMLADLPPTALADDALARVLARLDRAADPAPAPAPAADGEPGLPACLAGAAFGRWRWIGFGVQMRPIVLPQRGGARLFLLKAAPGTRLPKHSHSGDEFTAILTGAFAHEGGRYGPGDFDEADDDVEHRPVVTAEGECLCLVALEGNLRMSGVVGALLNPFVRF